MPRNDNQSSPYWDDLLQRMSLPQLQAMREKVQHAYNKALPDEKVGVKTLKRQRAALAQLDEAIDRSKVQAGVIGGGQSMLGSDLDQAFMVEKTGQPPVVVPLAPLEPEPPADAPAAAEPPPNPKDMAAAVAKGARKLGRLLRRREDLSDVPSAPSISDVTEDVVPRPGGGGGTSGSTDGNISVDRRANPPRRREEDNPFRQEEEWRNRPYQSVSAKSAPTSSKRKAPPVVPPMLQPGDVDVDIIKLEVRADDMKELFADNKLPYDAKLSREYVQLKKKIKELYSYGTSKKVDPATYRQKHKEVQDLATQLEYKVYKPLEGVDPRAPTMPERRGPDRPQSIRKSKQAQHVPAERESELSPLEETGMFRSESEARRASDKAYQTGVTRDAYEEMELLAHDIEKRDIKLTPVQQARLEQLYDEGGWIQQKVNDDLDMDERTYEALTWRFNQVLDDLRSDIFATPAYRSSDKVVPFPRKPKSVKENVTSSLETRELDVMDPVPKFQYLERLSGGDRVLSRNQQDKMRFLRVQSDLLGEMHIMKQTDTPEYKKRRKNFDRVARELFGELRRPGQ